MSCSNAIFEFSNFQKWKLYGTQIAGKYIAEGIIDPEAKKISFPDTRFRFIWSSQIKVSKKSPIKSLDREFQHLKSTGDQYGFEAVLKDNKVFIVFGKFKTQRDDFVLDGVIFGSGLLFAASGIAIPAAIFLGIGGSGVMDAWKKDAVDYDEEEHRKQKLIGLATAVTTGVFQFLSPIASWGASWGYALTGKTIESGLSGLGGYIVSAQMKGEKLSGKGAALAVVAGGVAGGVSSKLGNAMANEADDIALFVAKEAFVGAAGSGTSQITNNVMTKVMKKSLKENLENPFESLKESLKNPFEDVVISALQGGITAAAYSYPKAQAQKQANVDKKAKEELKEALRLKEELERRELDKLNKQSLTDDQIKQKLEQQLEENRQLTEELEQKLQKLDPENTNNDPATQELKQKLNQQIQESLRLEQQLDILIKRITLNKNLLAAKKKDNEDLDSQKKGAKEKYDLAEQNKNAVIKNNNEIIATNTKIIDANHGESIESYLRRGRTAEVSGGREPIKIPKKSHGNAAEHEALVQDAKQKIINDIAQGKTVTFKRHGNKIKTFSLPSNLQRPNKLPNTSTEYREYNRLSELTHGMDKEIWKLQSQIAKDEQGISKQLEQVKVSNQNVEALQNSIATQTCNPGKSIPDLQKEVIHLSKKSTDLKEKIDRIKNRIASEKESLADLNKRKDKEVQDREDKNNENFNANIKNAKEQGLEKSFDRCLRQGRTVEVDGKPIETPRWPTKEFIQHLIHEAALGKTIVFKKHGHYDKPYFLKAFKRLDSSNIWVEFAEKRVNDKKQDIEQLETDVKTNQELINTTQNTIQINEQTILTLKEGKSSCDSKDHNNAPTPPARDNKQPSPTPVIPKNTESPSKKSSSSTLKASPRAPLYFPLAPLYQPNETHVNPEKITKSDSEESSSSSSSEPSPRAPMYQPNNSESDSEESSSSSSDAPPRFRLNLPNETRVNPQENTESDSEESSSSSSDASPRAPMYQPNETRVNPQENTESDSEESSSSSSEIPPLHQKIFEEKATPQFDRVEFEKRWIRKAIINPPEITIEQLTDPNLVGINDKRLLHKIAYKRIQLGLNVTGTEIDQYRFNKLDRTEVKRVRAIYTTQAEVGKQIEDCVGLAISGLDFTQTSNQQLAINVLNKLIHNRYVGKERVYVERVSLKYVNHFISTLGLDKVSSLEMALHQIRSLYPYKSK